MHFVRCVLTSILDFNKFNKYKRKLLKIIRDICIIQIKYKNYRLKKFFFFLNYKEDVHNYLKEFEFIMREVNNDMSLRESRIKD